MTFPLPSANRPTLSFEFFPPRTPEAWHILTETLVCCREMRPDFVSVTYGAGGGTRERTLEVCKTVSHEHDMASMAHLTCVGHGREELDGILDQLHAAGVCTVLALRGDPPRGQAEFVPHPEGFEHASDLLAHISRRGDFRTACAFYPEVHPQAVSAEDDLRHLRTKQDLGALMGFSQMFFDAEVFLRFRDCARLAGVSIPLVAGIMPVGNLEAMYRFAKGCGASLPQSMVERLSVHTDGSPEQVQAGVELAVELCERLLQEGVDGLHLYTLNRTTSTPRIVDLLRLRGWFPAC